MEEVGAALKEPSNSGLAGSKVIPIRMKNKQTKCQIQNYSLREINCKCSTESKKSSLGNAWDLGKRTMQLFLLSQVEILGAGRSWKSH